MYGTQRERKPSGERLLWEVYRTCLELSASRTSFGVKRAKEVSSPDLEIEEKDRTAKKRWYRRDETYQCLIVRAERVFLFYLRKHTLRGDTLTEKQ